MEKDDKLLTSLNKYTTYHDTSRKFLESVDKIIENIDGEKAWYLLQTFEEISQPNILEHFEFEEKIVFPAILIAHSSLKSVRIILHNVKEHGILSEKAHEIHQLLADSKSPLDDASKKQVVGLLERIRELLDTHMKHEDETIYKIMQQSKSVRSLMAQYLFDL